MGKLDVIKVQGYSINVDQDYICLTDMAKVKDNSARSAEIIKNWINTQFTIDFLGIWESINNSADFNVVEFHHVKDLVKSGETVLSVKSWVELTNAKGICAKEGKYGGTYAHKDIAFEFGSAINPAFKLYLIKEFQRLREIESNTNNVEWNVRRLLCGTLYHVQTDAVKNFKIPYLGIPINKHFIAYAEEGDILNLAMWDFTAKQWREANLDLAGKGRNVREFASTNELTVLTSLEGINAEMMKVNQPYNVRLCKLKEASISQLATLTRIKPEFSLRKSATGEFEPYQTETIFPSKKLIN